MPADSFETALPGGAQIDLRRTRRQRRNQAAAVDRLPPHSPEAEQGVLGCALLAPKEVIPECIERLFDQGSEFYDLRHTTIWNCLLDLYDRGTEIDIITLQEDLKKKEMLAQVGGISYLEALPDKVPSAANVSYYLDIVCEKYLIRKAIYTCTDLVGRAYEFTGEVDALLDEVETGVISIRQNRERKDTPTMRELINGNIQTIEAFQQSQGALTGIATGFADFDRMTSGLQASEMIVIAARPSMGKTSLAMNIAENVALESKLPVGVFSLEMSAPALTMRMLCSRARVNLRNVTDGFLSERDFPKLTGAAGKLANAPIYIDDNGSLTIMQLRAKMRRMVARWGIKIGIIDYLQLLHGSRRSDSRQQEVGEIARAIKSLAKELGIPIIVLSQLNREVEREKSRKPRMSDLRESGEIEQSADVIGFLYKAITDEEDTDSWMYRDAIPVNLLIGKSRNGPTGDCPLIFLKQFTRFETASKLSDTDSPNTQKELGYE